MRHVIVVPLPSKWNSPPTVPLAADGRSVTLGGCLLQPPPAVNELTGEYSRRCNSHAALHKGEQLVAPVGVAATSKQRPHLPGRPVAPERAILVWSARPPRRSRRGGPPSPCPRADHLATRWSHLMVRSPGPPLHSGREDSSGFLRASRARRSAGPGSPAYAVERDPAGANRAQFLGCPRGNGRPWSAPPS